MPSLSNATILLGLSRNLPIKPNVNMTRSFVLSKVIVSQYYPCEHNYNNIYTGIKSVQPGTEIQGFQFPSIYRTHNTAYHESCALFKKCTRYFLQTQHIKRKQLLQPLQEKFPRPTLLVKSVDCCDVYIYTCSSLKNLQNRYNQLSPHTHFYFTLYSRFCGFIGITFTRPDFCSN